MGFHRTVLLKRAARFFFYCQKIIKVFLTIRVMPHKHSGEKNIISANLPCSIIVHRQGKPYIITIPPIFRIFCMLSFHIFGIFSIRSDLDQFRDSLYSICLRFCNRSF